MAGFRITREVGANPGSFVAVDVDGVLSDASRRQHYLTGASRDWSGFFEASIEDPPILEGIRLVKRFCHVRNLVLLTARPARLSDITQEWMYRHGVKWDLLAMRDNSDFGSSSETKRAILRELLADGYQPYLALDDDPRNVAMYRSEGIRTVYFHSGYYD